MEPDVVYWRRRYWEECRRAAGARIPELRIYHSRLAQIYNARLSNPSADAETLYTV
jgi:hypothetical protein